jgi:hypothetical protein
LNCEVHALRSELKHLRVFFQYVFVPKYSAKVEIIFEIVIKSIQQISRSARNDVLRGRFGSAQRPSGISVAEFRLLSGAEAPLLRYRE